MTGCSFSGVDGIERSMQLDRESTAHQPQSMDSTTHFDKLREECGVVAIHGHPDAARQAYLALYALQHRGQESAGIATADGTASCEHQGHGPGRRNLHRRCAAQAARRLWPSATRAIPPPAIRRC